MIRIAIALLVLIEINEVRGFSLLDRVNGQDIRTSIPDFRTSDADTGMRSAHYVGSFRGEPIRTRQHNAFIDDHGVPIPLMSFSDFGKMTLPHNRHHKTKTFVSGFKKTKFTENEIKDHDQLLAALLRL
ncbi:unnamed protein product [Caenorhabditis bovis]|uniref:Uncharacterized protein n=1 Tax=Caenorhabditis bovis TaxID=2654633 RepID=A0A8S1F5Z1_9PELO|nr:unnamed protein product [Caenorhabditis bovis]